MREEKKKRTAVPIPRGRPLRQPKRPREWRARPPVQPSERWWPTPVLSSTVDVGKIHRMIRQILGRLDPIEKRLDEIERILYENQPTP